MHFSYYPSIPYLYYIKHIGTQCQIKNSFEFWCELSEYGIKWNISKIKKTIVGREHFINLTFSLVLSNYVRLKNKFSSSNFYWTCVFPLQVFNPITILPFAISFEKSIFLKIKKSLHNSNFFRNVFNIYTAPLDDLWKFRGLILHRRIDNRIFPVLQR